MNATAQSPTGRAVRRCLAFTLTIAVMGLTPRMAGAQMTGMPGMPEMDPKAHGMSWGRAFFVLLDQLEYVPGREGSPIDLDAVGWYGGAYNRVWVRAQGEQSTRSRKGSGEVELLYGKLVDPFWDAVIGLRADRSWGPDVDAAQRVQLAVGFMGLAPYRFELEPTLFVSQRGDVSARLEAAFPVLITQRLVAEPEFEVNAALQSVPRYGVERGLNDYEMGVRVRYEFRRELAPYVGWSRAREGGSGGADDRLVFGFRLWR